MCHPGHNHFAAEQQAREMRRQLKAARLRERDPIIQRIRINGKEHAIFRDTRILPVIDRPSVMPTIGKRFRPNRTASDARTMEPVETGQPSVSKDKSGAPRRT